jgi:hypothetical protein
MRGYVLAVVIFCDPALLGRRARLAACASASPTCVSRELDASFFRLEGGLESTFLRGAGVVLLLLAIAVRFYLGRYEMVYNEHGAFLVGMDYVDQKSGCRLQWLLIFGLSRRRRFVWMRRWMLAAAMALTLVISFLVPRAVSALYVRPNEISLQRPYIEQHIHATRSAFGLEQSVKEIEFAAQPDAPIDATRAQAAARQRAPLGMEAVPRHHHAAPGAPHLLHVPRQRRRPLHHRRPVSAGAALAARARHRPTPGRARQLDQPRLHLHARLRPGARRSQQDDAGRACPS